jgi:hypothetical protein
MAIPAGSRHRFISAADARRDRSFGRPNRIQYDTKSGVFFLRFGRQVPSSSVSLQAARGAASCSDHIHANQGRSAR